MVNPVCKTRKALLYRIWICSFFLGFQIPVWAICPPFHSLTFVAGLIDFLTLLIAFPTRLFIPTIFVKVKLYPENMVIPPCDKPLSIMDIDEFEFRTQWHTSKSKSSLSFGLQKSRIASIFIAETKSQILSSNQKNLLGTAKILKLY